MAQEKDMIDRNSVIDWINAAHYGQLTLDSNDPVNKEFFKDQALFYAQRAMDRERNKSNEQLAKAHSQS